MMASWGCFTSFSSFYNTFCIVYLLIMDNVKEQSQLKLKLSLNKQEGKEKVSGKK